MSSESGYSCCATTAAATTATTRFHRSNQPPLKGETLRASDWSGERRLNLRALILNLKSQSYYSEIEYCGKIPLKIAPEGPVWYSPSYSRT